MKCILNISNFLERSLPFPFYCFLLFLRIVHLRRSSYCSLLFSGTLHVVGYIVPLGISFPFSLAFHFSYSSAICKALSDNHFAFLHFFIFGMILVSTSCTMLQTFVHSSSGTLSIGSNPLNPSLPLYNHKRFYLDHT